MLLIFQIDLTSQRNHLGCQHLILVLKQLEVILQIELHLLVNVPFNECLHTAKLLLQGSLDIHEFDLVLFLHPLKLGLHLLHRLLGWLLKASGRLLLFLKFFNLLAVCLKL